MKRKVDWKNDSKEITIAMQEKQINMPRYMLFNTNETGYYKRYKN